MVSDQSRVRVEALLLFDENQPGRKLAAAAAAADAAAADAPADGTADRALVSGSSVARKGERESKVPERKAGKDDESNRDRASGEPGIARRFRSWLVGVAEAAVSFILYSFLAAFYYFAFFFLVIFVGMVFEVLTGWELL